MIIGVPKEIKRDEYRVALLPVGADLLTKDGHTVLIEKEAGLGGGFDDRRYAGVVHYCVTNIPGAVSRTSTLALCNATLPYVRQLVSLGIEAFAALDPGHAAAINMTGQKLVNGPVAKAFPDLPAGQ